MINETPISTETPKLSPVPSDSVSIVVMVLLFFGLEVLALGFIIPHWFNDVLTADGAPGNPALAPVSALVFGGLMALPLLFTYSWGRNERYRVIFQTWLWGVLFFLVMIPIRLLPQTQVQLANVLQIIIAGLFAFGIHRRFRPVGYDVLGSTAVIPALLFALPWLVLHSFGSLLDTVLNLLAGLAFGAAVAAILQGVLVPALNRTGTAGWNITLGGFATGVLLNLMVAGYGFEGMPYLLMLCVPALGWAVMAFCRWGTTAPAGNGRAITLLVGVAVAVPLIVVDPDELLLVLNIGGRDILAMGFYAALMAMAIGWVLGFIGFALRNWLAADVRALPALGGVTAGLVGAGVVVALAGQPGWYGDRLFVVLRDQADLSDAAAIGDQRERATYVYDTLITHAESTQADLRGTLSLLQIRHRPYYLVNAIEVDGGPFVRLWLMTRSDVERIMDSPVLRPVYNDEGESLAEGTANSPRIRGPLWNLEMIGAPRVWEEFDARGQGIIVGQSDSGVDASHPELEDSYMGRDGNDDLHWYDPWLNKPTPYDVGGHGTHTIGSVLGNNVGVAPDAEFIACVNLERNLANPALYLECMQFMMAPFSQQGNDPFDGFPERGAHVLNNSWGCPPVEGCDPNALLPAVDALRAAGIFVVASAGNSGDSLFSVEDPIAIYDSSFTVGAVNQAGEVTGFSSRGPVRSDGSDRPKPDIVAPGEDILSAYPNDSHYEVNQGTSMAGPHVAGAVALMWSANPDLVGDIERTEQLLRDTATPADDSVSCGDSANSYGAGIINVYEAVRASFQ